MKKFTDHIGIVGAGIAGLTLGIVLKQNNINCVIFEKTSSINSYGAGISLSKNGINVLKYLDLESDLRNMSANPKIANFFSNSNFIKSIDIEHITTSRKSLHAVLLEKYLSLEGLIFYEHELCDIDIKSKKLSFKNNLEYQLLHIVSCDGIKSISRDKIYKDHSEPIYSGYSVWRTVIPYVQSEVNFYLGKDCHVVTYPINNNYINFVGAIKLKRNTRESWKEKGQLIDFENDIPKFIFDKYKGLKETKDLYKWGVYYRPINDIFYKDNITVIGDAAHPIVPFLGQGGCLALEDGYALGKLFANHKNSFNEAQIQYKNIRNKRVQNINKSSLMQAKFNHYQNPVLVFIRNLLMKYTNIISIRTRNIWEYDIRKEIKRLIF